MLFRKAKTEILIISKHISRFSSEFVPVDIEETFEDKL